MSLLRSQTMEYCHLICNEDHAWEVLNEIGDLSSMHFVDPDPSLPLINRPFSNYIKRCEEMETKLKYIKEQAEKFEQKIVECPDYKDLLKYFKDILEDRANKEGKKDGKTYFHELEQDVNDQHTWLNEQLRHFENLTEQKNSLKEYKAVLFNAQKIIGENFFPGMQGDQENPNDNSGYGLQNDRIGMNQIVGVIDSCESLRFERMVFRVTKGNAFIRLEDIDWQGDELVDPKTLLPMEKKVFVIIYPGGNQDIIKNKLNRICDSFNCSRYGFPGDQTQFLNKISEIDNQKKDSDNLCQMTKTNLLQFLKQWAQVRNGANCSKLEEYLMYTCKEKSLYDSLNLLKTDKSIYQGHAWVPQCDVEAITQALQLLSRKNDTGGAQINPGQAIPAGQSPPSSFVTNEFTSVFQLITDTYGVPRYKEINPSLFSLMTFPFLFGVMFGDIGHGGLLMLFGIFLLIKNDSLKNTPLGAFGQIRYFIFFMGFFAFYCGFIYNDFMSLSFNFFGSCYDAATPTKCPAPQVQSQECYNYVEEYRGEGSVDMPLPGGEVQKDVKYTYLDGCVYPFGVDPVWSIAGNNIAFMNSYKMKLAVIFGVIQMLLGIVLKGWNAIHFKEPLDFIFEFLPQIIFMTCTFGYMDFMIVYKWFLNFQGALAQYAPSIITLLINMPLAGGKPGNEEEGTNPYLYGKIDGKEQQSVQIALLLTALLMVPLMLVPKPIILYLKNKNKHSDAVFQGEKSMGQPLLDNDHQEEFDGAIQNKGSSQFGLGKSLEDNLQEQELQGGDAGHDEEHGFGELFVHQVIETIEFVLGSISNTASYLRLWALSLAHSQLADVFFQKGIAPFVEMGGVGGGFALVFGFYVFAMITFGVLMCMDVMECFLHALRLHWVEFQNKFYKADGVAFQPFSFVENMQKAGNKE